MAAIQRVAIHGVLTASRYALYHSGMSDLAPIYAPWGGNAEAMAADIEEKPDHGSGSGATAGNIPVVVLAANHGGGGEARLRR
jgi:hypothetical protein